MKAKEGYTALIVAVKNHTTHPSSSSAYSGSFFTTKAEVINYLTSNIDSIQLLTDSLRIGDASDYSIGTVFNCEGPRCPDTMPSRTMVILKSPPASWACTPTPASLSRA